LRYSATFMSVFSVKVWWFAAVLTLAVAFPRSVRAETAFTAEEIIQKAVERAAESSSSPGRYTYTKIAVTEELDSAGKVTERKEKVFKVVFENGRTRSKLMTVNGRPPAQADMKKQTDTESSGNQILGGAKSKRGEQRENFLTAEIVARFDFEVAAKAELNGRKAYEISFHPKSPELPVRHLVDRLLNRLSGTLWIDADEFELARADLKLNSEVNLLGGVIGTLKKLAYTMTRTRLAGGVWLKTSSSGDFEGRKLVDAMRIKTKSSSRDFQMAALP